MVNFTEFNRAVLNLGVAVNNSNPSNLGRDQAVSAVNSLDIETRSLESSFIQIKNDVNVQDFSSTLDTVDSVELARSGIVTFNCNNNIISLLPPPSLPPPLSLPLSHSSPSLLQALVSGSLCHSDYHRFICDDALHLLWRHLW